MPCFYLTPKQDDFNQIPELQVCIAEALYDAEAVLSNPSAFKPEGAVCKASIAMRDARLCRSLISTVSRSNAPLLCEARPPSWKR